VGCGTVCRNFEVEVLGGLLWLADDGCIVQGHWERVIVEVVVLLKLLDDCDYCCLLRMLRISGDLRSCSTSVM
jgi:hypothetical protein